MNFRSLFSADDIYTIERHTGLVSEFDLKGEDPAVESDPEKAPSGAVRR